MKGWEPKFNIFPSFFFTLRKTNEKLKNDIFKTTSVFKIIPEACCINLLVQIFSARKIVY